MKQNAFNLLRTSSPQGGDLDAYERILAKRTVVYDNQGCFWFIPVPNDQQLPVAVQFLAQHIGADVQRGQHPVTGDLNALFFSTVGCKKPEYVFSLMTSMTRVGCYFTDDQNQYVRHPAGLDERILEPRILPQGHDCVYAPRPPHPFAHLGPILLTMEMSGVAVHFGLNQLESHQIDERQKSLHPAVAAGARLYDRAVVNPITGDHRTNLVLGYKHDDPALVAIRGLKTCFSQNSGGRWLNARGEELGRTLVNKIGSKIQIHDQTGLGDPHVVVALPLSPLTGIEQAYLEQFVRVQAPVWGVRPQGIKIGTPRGSNELVMAMASRGEAARTFQHFFTTAFENSSLSFGTARVGPDASSNPFAGLIPGV